MRAHHEGGAPAPARTSLVVLDALRGLAALYVMLGHARWLLWVGNADYVASGERGLAWMLATSSASLRYGHQAVLLFFLLSGFCIHLRQARSLTQSSSSGRSHAVFDARQFAWRRLRRLYPPLVLAVALTALFDALGSTINPAYYAGRTPYELININVGGQSLGLIPLLGALTFQTSFATPQFGTNGPLWSLAYEFWFYVLYPVALVLSGRVGTWGLVRTTGLVAALAVILAYPLGAWIPGWIFSVLTLWVVWALGAAFAEVYAGRARIRGLPWAMPVALICLVPLAIGQPAQISDAARDLLWGLALGALLGYVLFAVRNDAVARSVNAAARLLAPLGAISYSLYIVHFPWLALLSAWWLSTHAELPRGAELAVPGALSAIGLGWVCWYVVERHFVSERAQRRGVATPSLAIAP